MGEAVSAGFCSDDGAVEGEAHPAGVPLKDEKPGPNLTMTRRMSSGTLIAGTALTAELDHGGLAARIQGGQHGFASS